MKLLILILSVFIAPTINAAQAKVFFVNLKDKQTVRSPFKVKMGVKGMVVCMANEETKNEKCGHHHILIDQTFIPEGQAVPKDDNHLHFGKKQIETEVSLTPGKHTLTLQFANYAHISFGEKLSKTITVNVR